MVFSQVWHRFLKKLVFICQSEINYWHIKSWRNFRIWQLNSMGYLCSKLVADIRRNISKFQDIKRTPRLTILLSIRHRIMVSDYPFCYLQSCLTHLQIWSHYHTICSMQHLSVYLFAMISFYSTHCSWYK